MTEDDPSLYFIEGRSFIVGVDDFDSDLMHNDVLFNAQDKARGVVINKVTRHFFCFCCIKSGNIGDLGSHLRKQTHHLKLQIVNPDCRKETVADTDKYLQQLQDRGRSTNLFGGLLREKLQYIDFSFGICCLPIFNGFHCKDCNYSCRKESTFQLHLRNKPHFLKGKALCFMVDSSKHIVQQKIVTRGLEYYPILLRETTASTSSTKNIEISVSKIMAEKETAFLASRALTFDSIEGNRALFTNYNDITGKDKFFEMAGYMEIAAGSSPSDRYNLLKLVANADARNSFEQHLLMACKSFMVFVNKAILNSTPLMRSKIENPSIQTFSEMNGNVFSAVSSAPNNYSMCLASLILMFTRLESLLEINKGFLGNHFSSKSIHDAMDVYINDTVLRSMVKLLIVDFSSIAVEPTAITTLTTGKYH